MNALTYTPFPLSELPETMRAFVERGARAIGCDPASLALPALCVCAGILGGSRRLQVKASWHAPPILWGCVLGESGTTKSPAMRLALAPLRRRARQDYERYEAQLQLAKASLEAQDAGQAAPDEAARDESASGEAGEEDSDRPRRPGVRRKRRKRKAPIAIPPPRRVLVSDTTTEALATIARDNPLGLLLGRDEIAGLFGGFDRYAAKGGGDEAFFLSAFDGESVEVDRKSEQEHILVHSMALSIIGTCQPAVFAKLMNSQRRESGLMARFLVVHPPMQAKKWSDGDFDARTDPAWSKVIDRLLELEQTVDADGSKVALVIDRTEEAQALYRDFFNAHNEEVCEETGDWRAFLAKAEQMPLRLALLLHHVRWAQSEVIEEGFDVSQVDAATMQSAIKLTKWFIKEGKRVYALLTSTPEERMAFELEDWIRERGGKTNVREIMRNGPRKFRKSEALVNQLLGLLTKLKRGSSTIVMNPMVIDGASSTSMPGTRPAEFRLNAA